MGSVSVSSCKCCMFVSCVHPVAVLNAAFCMTCSFYADVCNPLHHHTIYVVMTYNVLGNVILLIIICIH